MSDACGRLIPPRDANALAQALNTALSAEWDAASISAHWSRSWTTVAQELLDIFQSITSARDS
jgi:glycosyltransferase involved in cell wall biosynthesis